MGQILDALNQSHQDVKKVKNIQNINILPIEKVIVLCERWKELGIPFLMTINEFQKTVVMSEDLHLNYENYKSANEIEVLGFLTKLIVMSTGNLDKKLHCD
jgi:hypothetical protein